MTRDGWLDRPPSDKARPHRPGAPKATTLANVVADRTVRPARVPQCRICLATDTDLSRGRCRERAACDARQPTLDGL